MILVAIIAMGLGCSLRPMTSRDASDLAIDWIRTPGARQPMGRLEILDAEWRDDYPRSFFGKARPPDELRQGVWVVRVRRPENRTIAHVFVLDWDRCEVWQSPDLSLSPPSPLEPRR